MGIKLSVYEASRGLLCHGFRSDGVYREDQAVHFRDCGPPQPSHRRS
jgi:hypothetical protein